MNRMLNIGVIGDFDPEKNSHPSTNNAIQHAAKHLSVKANITWIPTGSLLA